MTEKELQCKLANRLNEYFTVEREVKTTCGTGRIDLVLKCRRSNAVLGVEVKKVERKRGRDAGVLHKQAVRYAQSEFTAFSTHYTRIPVFIYPALSYNYLISPEEMRLIDGREYFSDRHNRSHTHHFVNGWLGAWNVGELRVYLYKGKNYIRFMFNNETIWTNQPQYKSTDIVGLHESNYKKVITRIHDNNI